MTRIIQPRNLNLNILQVSKIVAYFWQKRYNLQIANYTKFQKHCLITKYQIDKIKK